MLKKGRFRRQAFEKPARREGTRRVGSLHRPRAFRPLLEEWRHLTGTFTFGGGESKAELDEIIRQSLALWK